MPALRPAAVATTNVVVLQSVLPLSLPSESGVRSWGKPTIGSEGGKEERKEEERRTIPFGEKAI